VLVLEHSFYGAGKSTLQKLDQKYPENIGLWCWRRKEKVGDTDGVRMHPWSQKGQKYHTNNKNKEG
jgi:hypothetical protein